MASAYGSLREFNEGEDWEDYIDRFDQYCIANDIRDSDSVEKKKALLLSVIGNHSYSILKALLAPAKPSTKSYKEICDLMKDHVSPKPIVIAERYIFYNRKQRNGESVTQYLTELRKLSETCNFKEFLEEVLCDMFVIGLTDHSAQKKMISDSNLTTKSAFETALSYELANQHIDTMHNKSELSINWIDDHVSVVARITIHLKIVSIAMPDVTTVMALVILAQDVKKKKKSTNREEDKSRRHAAKSKPHKYGKKSSKIKNLGWKMILIPMEL